jgi:AcrR family transcriptional regulator
MPRAFTEHETRRIRDDLRQAGADLFARRGLRSTTVDELARAAGISKGAYYRFYAGKEALFVELLDDLERSLQEEVEAAVRADPEQGLERLVDVAVHAVERHPLLPVAMSDEGLRALTSLPPERVAALQARDAALVHRVVAVLHTQGRDPGVSERVLLGLLRSLVFVGAQRQAIGSDLVDDVAQWLTEHLRAGLRAPAATRSRS